VTAGNQFGDGQGSHDPSKKGFYDGGKPVHAQDRGGMAKRSKKKKGARGDDFAPAARNAGIASSPLFPPGRGWLWGLILGLAVVLVYLPVWNAGFIWDDDLVVTTNPVIVGPLGLSEIWTTSHADICPFTLTTFWIEHALWGLAPAPYHVVNVLFHGGCAVVLWRVLRALRVPGAWLGAALWALHPVEVQSAAWIAEMKNTESGLFFLLAILFFLRWMKARDDGTRGDGNYALTLLFAALAMASKSSTVILPVVLCLCAWWMEGRWQWRNLARFAPVFLMSVAAGVLSLWTQGLQLAASVDPQWVRTWPERIAAAGDAIWFYLGKLVWPDPLIFMYPRWQIDAAQWTSYLPLLAVIFVAVVLWLGRESWSRPWFFVFAYLVVALFPALGLADNYIFRYSLVFDHFQYLASMGPLALLGAAIYLSANFETPWLRPGLCALVLLILAALSWQQAGIYKNSETLWTDTLTKNPTCWAGYYNLGNAFSHQGKISDALAQFQKSVEINPRYAKAHNNLGIALARLGHLDDGMAEFQKALEISPNDPDAYSNLGEAFLKKGEWDEAILQYQKALEINPNDADDEYDLGTALSKVGRGDEAMPHFRRARDLQSRAGSVDATR
jgi:tetratricopeptide (TPR) repeat protein